MLISKAGDRINGASRPSTVRLIAAIGILQAVASFAYPIAKYGLAIIEPFTFAFYRFVLSSSLLLLLTRLKKHDRPIDKRDYKHVFLLGVLIIPLNQTLFLLGQSMTAAGHGAFIFATTPMFIFILAMIHLRERYTHRRLIGVIAALAGVATIMLSGDIEVRRQYLVGDLIILVSVVAWAYYTIIGKRLVRRYGALRITAYALASGSALYFPFGLYHALRFDYSVATLEAWAAVVYMAVGLSLVVYVLWYWVLKYMEASRIAIFHNVQPVLATLIAALWLGEQLTGTFLVGGLIVLTGVLIAESKQTG
ncbi:MAG: DMT family transporter [candidate division Zixibacteria bacterium]|nr:DMT family transporter [candidate division Zixibacteria bacterium]MDH4032362.1 DMT family transporter [candidate division Zixibacteria bacterium]